MVLKSLLYAPFLLAALAASAQAGQGKAERAVMTPLPYADAARWYEAHRENLFETANAEIVKVPGDGRYVLETKTPLGRCAYLVQETAASSDQQIVYRIELLESIRGDISDLAMTITLSDRAGQTHVGLSLEVDLDNRLTPSFAVRKVAEYSIREACKYLEENAR
ncbi:MAG: hypothetical protein KY475_04190 [Planctomycetes bacterium]|nr:hypothetical protein [Planctomycetota bacterium]